MSDRRQRIAVSLFTSGLLAILISLGGTWGKAYGQTAPTPTPQGAVLGLTKSADDAAEPGTDLAFTIQVTNSGDAVARNVVVTDEVPAQLEVIDVTTTAGTATVAGQVVTVTIPELTPGQSAVITIETVVLDNASGTITNRASARADNVNGTTVTDADDATVVIGAPVSPSPSGAPVSPSPSGAPVSPSPSGAPASPTATPVTGATATPGAGTSPSAQPSAPAKLPDTGATSGMELPILFAGIALLVSGGVLFLHTRRVHNA